MTFEAHLALFRDADPGSCLLVDALGTWLATRIAARIDLLEIDYTVLESQLDEEAGKFVDAMLASPAFVVAVSEQIGWDVVPVAASARLFRDAMGRMAQRLAKRAERVYLVIAGYAVDLSQAGVTIGDAGETMTEALVLLTFLAAVVVLSIAAKRWRIPYPIAFVIGGVALAFMRHLPRPHPDPELIMLIVVPPLLYGAAWSTDWFQFRRAALPITLHAVGLVIVTMAAVAAVVHFIVPAFSWPLAFTLGAIVSPPDAVASEAIFERLAIPRRVAAIVSGECLMNDATALVLYRFALAAAVVGTFSLARAGLEFVVVAAGGILVGVAIAFLLEGVLRYIARRGFADALIASVVFLLAPFAAYLPAEALHVSGVLAAVSAGILLGRRSEGFIDSETRVLAASVWRLLIFVLNGFAFLLIGLELPFILEVLEPHVRDYALAGLLLSATVIVVRIAWIFPTSYLQWMLIPAIRKRDPKPAVAAGRSALVGGNARYRVARNRAGVTVHARRRALPAAQRNDLLHVLRDLRNVGGSRLNAGPDHRAARCDRDEPKPKARDRRADSRARSRHRAAAR